MKEHQRFCHAYDTIRAYSTVVGLGDLCVSLLAGQNLSGQDLGVDLETLKSCINANCDEMLDKYSKIGTYVSGYAYDLTEYSDKAQYQILNDKSVSDAFSTTLKIEIVKPQVTSIEKLSAISKVVDEPFSSYPSPVVLDTPHKYLIMINDWLDAAFYTFNQINFNTGESVNRTDEQIKTIVSGMLSQAGRFVFFSGFSEDQRAVAIQMYEVVNGVLDNLETETFETLSKYIEDNVDKVPLMRRIWAIG